MIVIVGEATDMPPEQAVVGLQITAVFCKLLKENPVAEGEAMLLPVP